jgi:hypothetical protein
LPSKSLLVATAIGFVFMIWLHSRFARVNTAPLVAIAKVVFDRVEALKPAGELLGH